MNRIKSHRIIFGICRKILLIGVCICLANSLPSQWCVGIGTQYPPEPTENCWFLDTISHVLSTYSEGRWIPQEGGIYGIKRFHGFLEMTTKTKETAMRNMVEWGTWTTYKVVYNDSILILIGLYNADAFDCRGKRLSLNTAGQCHWLPDAMEIQNQVAYCFPAAILGPSKNIYDCKTIVNWGILGTNAQWLIEPKYDAPFHFENGIAEVVYYGQKRKINEKGEIVE